MTCKYATGLLAMLMIVGCSQDNGPVSKAGKSCPGNQLKPGSVQYPIKLKANHLPNPVRIHARVISGGLPDGHAAFQELADRGVKTVISVDGALPDTEMAKKFGLRYVHLPHGYDGIPEQRVKELAKAVRDLDAPIYIHCHHGKNRSPVAASVACVAAGMIPRSQARSVLELAGTKLNYRGLYQSADEARPLTDALLDELQVDFPETVQVPEMAEAMVHIEYTHGHLKVIAETGWRTPESHPDLQPAHEALMLSEHFTELLRTEKAQQWPAPMLQILRDSETEARDLETQLRNWKPNGNGPPPTTLNQVANRITANCMSCHQQFRDTPLSEK